MSDETRNLLRANLQAIRERVGQACLRSGRTSDEITLVAVTKYAELDWVREMIDLGVTDLGEARPQQLVSRAQQLSLPVRWHLIGHLQRNKADEILPFAHLIHSVDSLRLFDHLSKLSQKQGQTPSILLETNVSGELSKDGFDVDQLLADWAEMQNCQSIQILGLMTMAPLSQNAEAARPVFRRLRELRDQLRAASDGKWPLSELSMGMSGDFEVAIEEGATIIRVGSRLFDGLGANHE